MRDLISLRANEVGTYILETGTTVRSASKHFGISKSTVHKDITERLQKSNRQLYEEVRKVLDKNKAERHIRGGQATHLKYKGAENRTNSPR